MAHHPSMPPVARLLHHVAAPTTKYTAPMMVCLDPSVARLVCGHEDIAALITTIDEAVELKYLTRWSSADRDGEREPTKLRVDEHKNAMVGVRTTTTGYNYLVRQEGFRIV